MASALQNSLGLAPRQIFVCDPDPKIRGKLKAAKMKTWNRDRSIRFKLVVGCAGTTSLNVGDRVFLEDGALLASASSGSSELSREEFIDLAETHRDDDIYVEDRASLSKKSIHSTIKMRLVDRSVRFLNGGFPVNFDGRINCVPPEHIQVTRALQVGAAVQAIRTRKRGLIPLDPRFCAWVTRTFSELCPGAAADRGNAQMN